MFFKRNIKTIPCSDIELNSQPIQPPTDTLAEMKEAKVKLEADIIGLLNRFSIEHHTSVYKLELETCASTCIDGKTEHIITGLLIQLDI